MINLKIREFENVSIYYLGIANGLIASSTAIVMQTVNQTAKQIANGIIANCKRI
jgi:hypothetical protein